MPKVHLWRSTWHQVCGGLLALLFYLLFLSFLGIRFNCNYLAYHGDCVCIQDRLDKDCRISGNATWKFCSPDAFRAASLAGQGETEASNKLTLAISYCLFACCFQEIFTSVLAQTTHRRNTGPTPTPVTTAVIVGRW